MDLIITIIILSIFLAVLLYLSAWFSGVETAITNVTTAQIAKMRRDGEKNAEYVVKLKKDLDRTVVTILIGNNIVNILMSTVAAIIANELFKTIGVTIMVIIITFLIVIFGEITPKSNAIFNCEKTVLKKARTLFYLNRALWPLGEFFIRISAAVIKLGGGKTQRSQLMVSDDDIRDLASFGEQEGSIQPIEKEIINGVFRFGDSKVSERMKRMAEVFHIKHDTPLDKATARVAAKGFTRVPVLDGKDRVVGVLYAKDLIDTKAEDLEGIMKKPYTVTPEMNITEVFANMRQRKVHLAVVSGDKGEPLGIITLEDILEDIVGEIFDEYHEKKGFPLRSGQKDTADWPQAGMS